MQLYRRALIVTGGLFFVGVLSGCGSPKAQGPMKMPTPEVGVVVITRQDIPVTTELPGRIEAMRMAEVRARVTGIILKKLFKEGDDVKEGDVLFQIDPAPLQAVLNSAQAILKKAQAAVDQTRAKEERFKALVEINAVSKQEYDDARAAALQAQAEVLNAKANVETAQLNLGYTSVTAPISGHIGVARVTEGALVSQIEGTLLATIQQIDPVYCDFSQSSTEVLRLRRSLDKGDLQRIAPGAVKVTLLLDDGTVYDEDGKLLFTDLVVDSSTGMVTLRAEFPNADHILWPGMFARVRLTQAVNAGTLTVPQRAVILGPGGTASTMVVTADNKVEARNVKLGAAVGDQWIAEDGLKAGDRVIVEGLLKVRPGGEAKAVPFTPGTDQPGPKK